MKIKVGQEVDMQPDKRLVQHGRDFSIGDVFEALVELITNADDSYSRLFRRGKRKRDGGDILIEYSEQRKGQHSCIVVRDRAEGMDASDMQRCLLRPGAYSSEAGNRGYMGRGAKDCTALGNLIFESIKDGRYYRCRITHNLKFVLEEVGTKATIEHRKSLGVEKGNGTSVTLALNPNVTIPRYKTLIADLPWYYALRGIMSEKSDSVVRLRKLREKHFKADRLVFRPPEGEQVINETFQIPGYRDATAHLEIWRVADKLEEATKGPRFERAGVLVKGERAIHEITFFSDEFKRNPYARRYFGQLQCPYIDKLMAEYEQRRSKDEVHPPENPRLLLDPNRRFGLDERHPFVSALFQVPSECLRMLIAKDEEKDRRQDREIANRETRSRLDRLAKAAGRFLQEQLEEIEELSLGDEVDDAAFAKKGIRIFPEFPRVGIGGERALTVYINRSFLTNDSQPVVVKSDCTESVEILGSPVVLHPHKTKQDRLLGSFKIKGIKLSDGVVITAKCEGLPEAEAIVVVAEEVLEDRSFVNPLEFERQKYQVRQGSRRTVRLYAKFPDVVADETTVKITSADGSKVAVRGRCILRPIAGSNYAEGAVIVEGRTLKPIFDTSILQPLEYQGIINVQIA